MVGGEWLLFKNWGIKQFEKSKEYSEAASKSPKLLKVQKVCSEVKRVEFPLR